MQQPAEADQAAVAAAAAAAQAAERSARLQKRADAVEAAAAAAALAREQLLAEQRGEEEGGAGAVNEGGSEEEKKGEEERAAAEAERKEESDIEEEPAVLTSRLRQMKMEHDAELAKARREAIRTKEESDMKIATLLSLQMQQAQLPLERRRGGPRLDSKSNRLFDGAKEKFDEWLMFIKQQIRSFPNDLVTDQDKIINAASMFEKVALEWWSDTDLCDTIHTWEEFELALVERFRSVNAVGDAVARFFDGRSSHLDQKESQSVEEYISTFERSLRTIPMSVLPDHQRAMKFMVGLKPSLKGRVREVISMEKATMKEVKKVALLKEQMVILSSPHSSVSSSSSSSFHAMTVAPMDDGMEMTQAEFLNYIQKQTQHYLAAGGRGAGQQQSSSTSGNSYSPWKGRAEGQQQASSSTSGSLGRSKGKCPFNLKPGENQELKDKRWNEGTCFNCGGGHRAANCPQSKK